MQPILDKVAERRITLLIGQYAQAWFLQTKKIYLDRKGAKLARVSTLILCFATPFAP